MTNTQALTEVHLACGDTISTASIPRIGAYRNCIHCDRKVRVASIGTPAVPAANTLARLGNGLLSDEELQSGFLAARAMGKILTDDIITAIVRAVITPECGNCLDPRNGVHAMDCPKHVAPVITMQVNDLSTIDAAKALMNITGRTENYVHNSILLPAQRKGTFSARTATGFGYTVTADDDAQCWHITYETEADE